MRKKATEIIEEEFKLTVANLKILDAIAADRQVVSLTEPPGWQETPMLATYYDTPDYSLLRQGVAFRFRRQGVALWMACIKGHGALQGGISRRQEWEQPVPGPVDRFGALPPGFVRDQGQILLAHDPPLVPVLVTDFLRRACLLRLVDDSRAELVLDQGEIRAGGRQQVLYEVEIEKVSGSFGPVCQLAEDLAKRYNLQPSSQSKFSLGLSLLGMQSV